MIKIKFNKDKKIIYYGKIFKTIFNRQYFKNKMHFSFICTQKWYLTKSILN